MVFDVKISSKALCETPIEFQQWKAFRIAQHVIQLDQFRIP